MKKSELSPEQIMAWLQKIQNSPNTSIPVLRTANAVYDAKLVTESVAAGMSTLDTGNILRAANQPLVGVRTFKGNQLDPNKTHVVLGLRGFYDASQTVGETDAIVALLPFATAPAAYIKNSEVRLLQEGELFRSSGADVFVTGTPTGNDDTYRDLLPVIIRGGIDFNIQTKTPAGATIPTGASIKYEYRAIELTKRA